MQPLSASSVHFSHKMCSQERGKITVEYKSSQNQQLLPNSEILLRGHSSGEPVNRIRRSYGYTGSQKWVPPHSHCKEGPKISGVCFSRTKLNMEGSSLRTENQSFHFLQSNSPSGATPSSFRSEGAGVLWQFFPRGEQGKYFKSQNYSPGNFKSFGTYSKLEKVIPGASTGKSLHRLQNLYRGQTNVKNPILENLQIEKNNQSCVKVTKTSDTSSSPDCRSMHIHVKSIRSVYRLLATKQSWDHELSIDSATRMDLEWWHHAVTSWNGCPIHIGAVDLQMETGASQTGWGAVIANKKAAGFWNHRLSMMPSNYREMMAILLALKAFKELDNKVVQVCTDNTAAAAYINHLGGPSKQLC